MFVQFTVLYDYFDYMHIMQFVVHFWANDLNRLLSQIILPIFTKFNKIYKYTTLIFVFIKLS